MRGAVRPRGRGPAGVGLATLAFLSANGCGPRPRPAGQAAGPPNVVIVVIDTLRQDHLKAYGYARETAPTLSRLAREGARLDGLSPTSWTKPAVASLLTGLHPLRHQAIGFGDSLPQAAFTLAERLRARGYDTLGVTANGFSSARFGFEQGFRELVYLADVGYSPFATADEVDRELFARLAALRQPYLLFVHYLDPHAPYEPPAWGDVGPDARRARGIAIQDLEMETFFERPGSFLRRALDTYDGEIVRADAALGRLLKRLEQAGLMRSTLTVALSDHGEEFQEHGRMGHGQSLYEEVVRVPLLFHWPGHIPAGTQHGTASLLDVLPTVLELAGLPFDGGQLDGRSVARELTGGADAGVPRSFLLHVDAMSHHYLALQRGQRKLLLGRYPQRKQLFDLARDPGEQVNRLEDARPPADWDELGRELAARHGALVAQALPRVIAEVSAPARGDLAALGYVAAAPGGERRGIPSPVRPPDPDPADRLGWEDPRTFKPCLDLGTPGAADQLLSGWYAAQGEGRWSWPEAELLLSLPPGPANRLRLRLQGQRREPGAARLRVLTGARLVLERDLPAGAFELVAALPEQARDEARDGLLRLRLERKPAYVPADVTSRPAGAAAAAADHRRLGLFLARACLETDRTSAVPLLSLRR